MWSLQITLSSTHDFENPSKNQDTSRWRIWNWIMDFAYYYIFFVVIKRGGATHEGCTYAKVVEYICLVGLVWVFCLVICMHVIVWMNVNHVRFILFFVWKLNRYKLMTWCLYIVSQHSNWCGIWYVSRQYIAYTLRFGVI